MKVNGPGGSSSDTALDKIINKNTDLVNSFAPQLPNSVIQYAKAKTVADVAT